MPTPSMQGSRLPRMFPTSNWGTSVSASEKRRGPLGSSAASVTSGGSHLLPGNASSAGLSDSMNQPFGSGATNSPQKNAQQKRDLNIPNKMQVLEQYISRFPLVSPTTAPPITTIIEGGNESGKHPHHHHHHHRAGGQQVRFAGDGDDDHHNDGTVGGDDNDGVSGEDGEEETAQKKAEREISSKRAAREAAKQSYELLRRQKVDSWIQMAERNLRKVRRENETLSAIARLTQSNALVNDERYERALEALRAEAELADELRQSGFGPMMHEFAERIDEIQRNMSRIVVETNKRTIEELATLRENFEKELAKFQKELEEEANSGLSTKLDWIQKNRDLHRAVTEQMFVSDDLAKDHGALEHRHRKRRLDASLTVDEVALLEETVSNARRENARLKEKLGTLECELSLAQAKENRAKSERAGLFSVSSQQQQQQKTAQPASSSVSGGGGGGSLPRPTSATGNHPLPRPSSAASHTAAVAGGGGGGGGSARPGSATGGGVNEPHPQRPPTASSTTTAGAATTTTTSSGSTDEAMAAEAQSLFDRINQTIQIESRNLQTARHAHTEALKQRTELEVYLKHAILQYQSQLQNLHYSVRQGLKADSGGTGVAAVNAAVRYAHQQEQPLGHTVAAQRTKSRRRTTLAQDLANPDGAHRVKKVEATVFTIEDRQSVVDSLLSLPRVLTLLFDPVSAANRIRRSQQLKRQQRSAGRQQQQQQHMARDEPLPVQKKKKKTKRSSKKRQVGFDSGTSQQQQRGSSGDEESDGGSGSGYASDSSATSSSIMFAASAAGGGGGTASSSPPASSQQQQQSASATAGGMSATDTRLYDDLAKLGVDVVGSRPGFVFNMGAPPGGTRGAGGAYYDDDDDESDDDDGFGGDRDTHKQQHQQHVNSTTAMTLDDDEVEAARPVDDENDLAFAAQNVPHGAPAPLNEDELWERWNQWSQSAERHIAQQQARQQPKKK